MDQFASDDAKTAFVNLPLKSVCARGSNISIPTLFEPWKTKSPLRVKYCKNLYLGNVNPLITDCPS